MGDNLVIRFDLLYRHLSAVRQQHFRVRDDAAPSRPHRDALALSPIDKVRNNKEIAGEAHLLDNLDLHLQPLAVLRLQLRADLLQLAQQSQPLLQPVAAGVLKQALQRLARRHGEDGEVVLAELQLEVAALGHLHRVAQGLWAPAELACHHVWRLEIQLVGGKLEAARIADHLAGLDAEQHLVGVCLVLVEIVAVVGRHQLDAEIMAQFLQARIDLPLLRDAVLLHLEVEAVAEELAQLQSLFPRRIHAAVADQPRHLAVQAGGEGDQPFVVVGQQPAVNARLVVEASRLRHRSQLHQVAVAVLVHRQEDEVEVVARALVVDEVVSLGDVQLAADDGTQASFLGLGVELQRAVHRPVVGDSHGVHAVFFRFLNQVADADGTIEHGILRVDVQMGEHEGKIEREKLERLAAATFSDSGRAIPH